MDFFCWKIGLFDMAVNHWPFGPHIERDLAEEEVDWKSYFRMLKNYFCSLYQPNDFEDNEDMFRAHIARYELSNETLFTNKVEI